MTTIAYLTCAALTSAYRRDERLPVEVARDVLARIERHRSADWIAGINSSMAPERFCSSRTIWQIFCKTRKPSGGRV